MAIAISWTYDVTKSIQHNKITLAAAAVRVLGSSRIQMQKFSFRCLYTNFQKVYSQRQ